MTRQAWIGIAVALLLGAGARDAAAQAAPQAPPPPAAQDANLPPAVRAGSPDAAVQLEAFCDIEDDACGRLVFVLSRVAEAYPAEIGIRFRHHAPAGRERGAAAYRTTLAAAKQGRGWAMLEMACANTDRLDDPGLQSMVAQLGLDADRAAADAGSDEATQVMAGDEAEAGTLKLGSAPAVFVNGARLDAPYTVEAIAAAVLRKT